MRPDPVQRRSRERLQAILEAAEALLEHRPFENIAVAEIIARAGSSTGSFYARFSGKDALLPALYERYQADLPARLESFREALAPGELSLAEACRRLVDALGGFFRGRENLMRAITLYARAHPADIEPALPSRKRLHEQMLDLLLPYRAEIRRPDPEEAIRAGLFLATSAVREAVLFPGAPFAASTGLSTGQISEAVAGMLFAYLTSDIEGGNIE